MHSEDLARKEAAARVYELLETRLGYLTTEASQLKLALNSTNEAYYQNYITEGLRRLDMHIGLVGEKVKLIQTIVKGY